MGKLKKRNSINPGVFFTEGENEFHFIELLKIHYGQKGFLPHIEDCHGGSPQNIVENALKYLYTHDFSKKALIIDDDRELTKADRDRLEKRHFFIIESSGCFDKEVLKILLTDPNNKNIKEKFKKCLCSKDYKNLLHKEFINNGSKTKIEVEDLKKILPKNLLDSLRDEVTWLKNCIEFIEKECVNNQES